MHQIGHVGRAAAVTPLVKVTKWTTTAENSWPWEKRGIATTPSGLQKPPRRAECPINYLEGKSMLCEIHEFALQGKGQQGTLMLRAPGNSMATNTS